MALTDRIKGRLKKAAGDLADDPVLRREGVRDERKADAKEELREAQDRVVEKAEKIRDLDRDT